MNRFQRFITALAIVGGCVLSGRAVTIEACLDAARENYPLIKQRGLLEATETLQLSDINKGWLPHVEAFAQGTVQNVVPSFPSALSNVMHQMGGDIKGLGKVQYKVGVDVSQTIWDGGTSRSRRDIARSSTAVSEAALEVDLYAIRQRVEGAYFATILIGVQIEEIENTLVVYDTNLKRMRSMLANGTAMQADVDMVEAQRLELEQRLVQAQQAERGYRDVLSLLTGMELREAQLEMPDARVPVGSDCHRPELALLDSRISLNEAQRSLVDNSLMPRIGFFAQTYYGYPGIDYFKAMMSRQLSFNILAGVKVSWTIDPFYTKKNSLTRLDVANRQIEIDRETFLLNNSTLRASQMEDIRGIEKMMTSDDRIVQLRSNVRHAAESQLSNGIIDATALVSKINDEMQAKLQSQYHHVQLQQAIYNLKNTLNQ